MIFKCCYYHLDFQYFIWCETKQNETKQDTICKMPHLPNSVTTPIQRATKSLFKSEKKVWIQDKGWGKNEITLIWKDKDEVKNKWIYIYN